MTHGNTRTLLIAALSLPVVAQITIEPKGTQPSREGPAGFFTGSVRIDPLFEPKNPSQASAGRVTFQPGARSAWHTHPLGQVLIVTTGRGWIQEWGATKRVMQEGDVVRIAPGVKHWHGATAATAMAHIAIQEQLDGKVVEWMEKVSDDDYLK